jgi:hypothetical protein
MRPDVHSVSQIGGSSHHRNLAEWGFQKMLKGFNFDLRVQTMLDKTKW